MTGWLAPGVRPRHARRRAWSWASIGLAPALLIGGIAVAGSQGPTDVGNVELSVGSTVTLIGHGHGHGRGLGQWGAYGYARKGWSANQILRHYYGGTTAGKVDRPEILVKLTQQSSVNVHADAGMRVGGQPVAPGQAVSLSGNTATILSGCGGGAVRTVRVPQPFVEPINMGPSRPPAEFLKFCGSNTAYRGALGYDGGGVANKLHVDDYVKGVIPRESVPAWGDSGGMEALKAQAVAARTYALAAIAGGKKIDDTQNSQVYGGVSGEDPRTNKAADATAGQIRLQNGRPAFTEFSASTGGYTAGGRFPAVADAGDSASPNHNWTAEVSAGSIGSAFGVGALRSFEVIEANGLGPENGRAIKVRAVGSAGTVETTGEEARTKLGLKSSWFAIKGQTTRPKIVTPPTGPGAGGSLDFGSLNQLVDQVVPGASQLLSLATDAMNGKVGDLGGITGPLGKALGLPALTLDGTGVTQLFEQGMLFFTRQTGAHALVGAGLARYQARGGIAVLGFPTRDVLR
ncbi:SpoIID/LytB domain-containing protein [Gordonia sp. ABSL1-1]|uniref:SpoIID/LytB domain-containing protein n=1 Tax=Gordonia sp. ABSL1-1 TaxID=3053923 RepID=UPI0025731375|nr:SpoIID/LytB domain-containing protein [Gordonia sp. ABSL1-1]MDL9937639.1 SpoIID/LytB domain-containing protein [Gordonia sp. ABSL1-1]